MTKKHMERIEREKSKACYGIYKNMWNYGYGAKAFQRF